MDQQEGYSLIEMIVSLSLFVVSILLVSSLYSFVQRTYQAGSDKAEVSQNARVALDRMSREVRQAVDLVGTLPLDYASATSSLEFQDGHDQTSINYIKYYLSGQNLMRDVKYYYFPAAPSTKVVWNHLDGAGIAPISTTTSSGVVGEYYSSLKYFSTNNGLSVEMVIKKNNAQFKLQTELYYRN